MKQDHGHPGGSLSIADILTVLYFKEMNIDPKNLKDENRDRFILSKGHSAPALYATLYEKGILSADDTKSFRKINGIAFLVFRFVSLTDNVSKHFDRPPGPHY